MNKFEQLIRSRKFWSAVVALGFVLFGERAGIDQAELILSVSTLAAYILGVALEDGLQAKG